MAHGDEKTRHSAYADYQEITFQKRAQLPTISKNSIIPPHQNL
jgi:hypothetical protein